MIAEAGLFALILALFAAALQSTIPLYGAQRGDAGLMAFAKPAAVAQCLLIAFAFFALMWLHITSDFSVVNVVENSHTAKPLLYKIAGVWGNHEGSMLLWTFILVLYGLALALFGKALPPALKARALAVQGMIGFAFLLFILLTSNPFLRIDPPPSNGQGLNPLLQDPGLAFHPPFLYLGYVGFSMSFSFAIAALIDGRVDAAWARWVRPWTLLAWSALTLGVAMGMWWSYYTLGWGGYWAWDPVENASFIPWLAGTALIHSAIVAEKRDTLRAWTIFLALVTFSLSLLGTFLVRSGVLTSVHSFANDPRRGTFILILLAAVTGGSFALYAARAPGLKAGSRFNFVSRESALLLNNILLTVAAATVLLGTLYPLLIDALGLGKISVGPPYFNAVIAPIAVLLFIVTAIGPFLAWKRGNLGYALRQLRPALLAAVLAAVAAFIIEGFSQRGVGVALGYGLAAWLFVGSLAEWAERVALFRRPLAVSLGRAVSLPRSIYGMMLGHIGLALLLAGVTGSVAGKLEFAGVMRPGDHSAFAGYEVRFLGVDAAVQGPNYTAIRAYLLITRGGRLVSELTPERRLFTDPPQPLSTVAIHTDFLSDLYAVLGDPAPHGGYAVRVFRNPLIPCLFLGAILMVLGGVVSLTDRRHRIGAPVRRAAAARTAPMPLPAVPQAAKAGWPTRIPLIAVSLLIVTLGYRLYLIANGDTPDLIPSVLISRPAPAFNLPGLRDNESGFATADLKGHVTLINFFASWCVPCREEHPLLTRVDGHGIVLIGIDYKDRPEDAEAWLAQLGDPYKHIAADLRGRTGIDFGVYGVPESYLIDKAGIIRFKQTGPLTDEIIRGKIIPLARELNK